VPWRGTEVCFREKIGVRPLCNRRRKSTSALNSTTTRTDSTVGTIQLYHQLLLMYRKHYDSLSLFYAHFFFIGQSNRSFFLYIFLLFFITSQMAPRKKTPSVSKKPNQRTMMARKYTQVKSPRGKFNVSEVIRIVFINAYCQYSRFYNYSYIFKF